MTQTTNKTNERIILIQPGFPAITSANVEKFAQKLEKFEADGIFNWDLMDRAGLTAKFEIRDKGKRSLMAFESNSDIEACQRAGSAISRISQKVRSGELVVQFQPGSAAERDVAPALMKSLGITAPASSVEPTIEDFEGLEGLGDFMSEE